MFGQSVFLAAASLLVPTALAGVQGQATVRPQPRTHGQANAGANATSSNPSLAAQPPLASIEHQVSE